MKGKKRVKRKIGLGSIVRKRFGDIEENTGEGRNRRMSEDVVGYVQAALGKNIFFDQFRDGKKKDMSSSSLVFLSLKFEVDMDEPLYNSNEK